jgi:cytochrome P450 family 135
VDPGQPAVSIPGEADGLLGAAGQALYERKRAPLDGVLTAAIDARRHRPAGDADILGRVVHDEPELPTEAIVDELLALLMAAQEPAAAALTWLLERVARQPELVERFAAGGDEGFRSAAVRESLRLRPAAIAALRRLTAAREVAGRRLPAGIVLMMPIPVLHRDRRAYPDPDAFRPERWMTASPPTAFWPFGGGARRCIGEALAHAYFDALVPAILRRVRLRPAWPQPERMVLRGTILVPHRSALVMAQAARGADG